MTPKHAKLQIFIQVNLYFFQNIHHWKKTKTCQERPNLVPGCLIQVFYKTTTFPRLPLLNGPKNGRLIQVWLYFLKKKLCRKDEIINKLVETQNTVLNTVSANYNNQHSNTLNQSSSSLTSNNLNENSHNTKQLASQESQNPPIARHCSSKLQEISHPTQKHHQRPEQNIAMKNIYAGNLPEDITKQDICELFGLNLTSYW